MYIREPIADSAGLSMFQDLLLKALNNPYSLSHSVPYALMKYEVFLGTISNFSRVNSSVFSENSCLRMKRNNIDIGYSTNEEKIN